MSLRFEDLLVWQKAYNFVLLTYKALSGYPKEENTDYAHSFSVLPCRYRPI